MAVSKGKDWEMFFRNFVKEHNSSCSEGKQIDIVRLYDVIGKKTINQAADYVCYRYPHEVYVECKSVHDNSFSYYFQPQYTRLIEKTKVPGLRAGFLIWFIEDKCIYWVDVNWLECFYSNTGIKSISVKRLENYISTGARGVYKVDAKFAITNPKSMDIDALFDYIKQGI